MWNALQTRRPVLLLALLIGLVLLAALPVLAYPLGRDQGMYVNIGRSILAGGTPFIDMWDIKPPPIYYIYAAGLRVFGMTTSAVRAIDFVFVPLGMLGIFAIGAHLKGRRLGWLAMIFYGVFYFNEDFPSLTQNDSLVTVPMIGAAYAALRAADAKIGSAAAWRWALLTGALCGIILWFKHYFVFFVLALVIHQLLARRQMWRSRGFLREVSAFCAGGLLTGGSMLLYFWSQGMMQEMLVIAQGTAAYNAQGYDFAAFVGNMGSYLYFKWLVWSPLLVGAVLWLPTRLLSDATFSHWRLVLLWWVAALAFLLIQAKGFDTHWIPMLPPLALLAADALDTLVQAIQRRAARQSLATALYALAIVSLVSVLAATTWGRSWRYLAGQEDRVSYYARFQANDLKPEESLQVAQFLDANTADGDTLFVWGFRPEVTFMANLRPATRWQAHFPLVATWYPDEWQQQNVDILWAAMPPYVLVLEDDYMPWVTDRPEDSHQLLQEYTELNNWLIANYERIDPIGDFIIWRRTS